MNIEINTGEAVFLPTESNMRFTRMVARAGTLASRFATSVHERGESSTSRMQPLWFEAKTL